MRRARLRFVTAHSIYDDDRDEITIFTTEYASFALFWQMLVKDKTWYYQYPMYVHPEQRAFIKERLQIANRAVEWDAKWQESHQHQWRKVLTDKDDYYRSKI